MNNKLNWYGIKEIEEYFEFISKNQKTLSSFFKNEPKEVKEKRQYLSERFYEVNKKNIEIVDTKLLPDLIQKTSYISFCVLSFEKDIRKNISEILKQNEIKEGVYKNTKEVIEIALGQFCVKDKCDYFTEDHILFDENFQPFFKTITHEGMYYIKAIPEYIDEMNRDYGIDFNIILHEEPKL